MLSRERMQNLFLEMIQTYSPSKGEKESPGYFYQNLDLHRRNFYTLLHLATRLPGPSQFVTSVHSVTRYLSESCRLSAD